MKKDIESYAHRDKERANNPPVGLVTPATDKDTGKKTYAHDPHIDPELSWAGKAEHTSFEVPTVSLHVHERIDPRTIVEAVRKRNGDPASQNSLFEDPGENPPIRQASDPDEYLPSGARICRRMPLVSRCAAILCDLLGLPTTILEPLDTLRLAWCSEPTVHGGKNTRP